MLPWTEKFCMMSKTSWSDHDEMRSLAAQLESEGAKLESSLDQPASSKEELFERGIRMIEASERIDGFQFLMRMSTANSDASSTKFFERLAGRLPV